MVSEESVVITAPSVEEAVILGLTRLTATREEVEIEVLDEGNRGFLGIGAREAKVRVTRLPEVSRPVASTAEGAPKPQTPVPSRAEPEPQASKEPVVEKSAPEAAKAAPAVEKAPAPESKPVVTPPVSESPVRPAAEAAARVAPKDAAVTEPAASELTPPAAEKASEPPTKADGLDRERLTQIAKDVSEHLLPGLEIETSVEWLDEDRPTMWIALGGRDASSLVGPRARNLHAIQYLFRALIYHQLDDEYNVVVDADGYRRRRRRSLESMAEKKADRAVELGKTMRLRPMPAHERRIVHIVLRKDNRVTTESVGKGRDRAVTVIPTKTRS